VDVVLLTLDLKKLNAGNGDIAVEIWFDEIKIFDQYLIAQERQIKHEYDDTSGKHKLQILLKDKTLTVDHEDVELHPMVEISNVSLDGVNIDNLMHQLATYTHSEGSEQTHKFFGRMGCEGTVALKWHSPYYQWILEQTHP
jgi:hypothetical protein